MGYLETLAPRRLAFDWDNVGLQVGSLAGHVNKVLVALDVDEHVLSEAKGAGADFIVTHHPFIFHPIQAVRTDLPLGRLIQEALLSGIRIYAAHTNLDVAPGGLNDILAERLGLRETEVLRVAGHDQLEKLAVFVPAGHVDNVREALAAAGAGWIGNYSHCTFQAPGTGTFMPREGTNPFIGTEGKLERIGEVRLETVMKASQRRRVLAAMLKAHPYEEVAYDIYPLLNEGRPYGLGRVGTLEKTATLAEFCNNIKETLGVGSLRVTGEPGRLIKKAAVSGGAGGDMIHAATFAGADVLVTGDVKYHEARDAAAMGLAVIDAGHDATERIVVPFLCSYLKECFRKDGYSVDVIASAVETAPWRLF